METINKIDEKNIEIIKTIEEKTIYNYDFLIQQKTEILAALKEVEDLLLKFQ